MNRLPQTEYDRKFGTSPPFRLKNTTTILTNALYAYNWEISSNGTAGKYLPFNFLMISNNSATCPIDVYINGDQTVFKTIFPSTIQKFDQDSLPALYSVVLKNVGSGTIAINEVEVFAQKVAINQEKMAQDVHREMVSKKTTNISSLRWY